MPSYVQRTIDSGELLELARDLIEDPDDNPEYTRGILELLHDATGTTVEELRAIMFRSPFMRYAIDVVGGPPENAIDWQRVAEVLYEELHPETLTPNEPTPEWAAPPDWRPQEVAHRDSVLPESLHREIRDALGGDSNDAEHDALVAVADHFGLQWTSFDDRP